MGPGAGGTPLIINGSFLDIGTTRSVQIGDSSTCDIVSIRYYRGNGKRLIIFHNYHKNRAIKKIKS